MLLVLHGASAVKVLLILLINYGIAKLSASSRLGPVLSWVFNAVVLFGIERNSGYAYGSIWPPLQFLVRCSYLDYPYLTKYVQDTLQGAYPRWYISFNITMLRLISFNLDYYWACRRNGLADASAQILVIYHSHQSVYRRKPQFPA